MGSSRKRWRTASRGRARAAPSFSSTATALPALDDERAVALWRGSLAFAKRDWKRAADEFARGDAVLRTYPKALRNRFALEAAETALAAGQHDDADAYIAMVQKNEPGPGD